MTGRERARRAADAMWAGDAASQWMGLRLIEVGEGHAVMELEVAAHHCNGHGTCHGGVIFSLADSAFAFACNSRNQATVAQHANVSFVAPGQAGDILRAEAREVTLAGRSGIYDVAVIRADGAVVAQFRGMSRAIEGHLFEEGA
ncbi:hydroxyphenylacetyl-CoA thioesterase PaaI [Jannaschia sp. S6380]|uniref:hydroxyphenylacetyl-CoA thioesterase PaaI n=1 Tax=Jannaschia sp. S6380 TaxID=2926408 RepID=UPI001FF26FD4|nr:hydroxyphenylacetyl-CoA thioesterase PaaI [Jannaschia sp. S6380]MCK0168368.1 hydroxyphenylacetyl-CoA thioesterase PaaI [Jannaschia sp. S6380]